MKGEGQELPTGEANATTVIATSGGGDGTFGVYVEHVDNGSGLPMVGRLIVDLDGSYAAALEKN